MASDYWVSYICDLFTPHGILTPEAEARLGLSITSMLSQGHVEIAQDVLVPLFTFLRDSLIGSLHLNKAAACASHDVPVLEPSQQA